MRKLLVCIIACIYGTLNAQIITSVPAFPTQDEEVTIYYDSNLGNAEVSSVVPIYMHTGVITTNSSSPTDWQNVIGNWGTADGQVVMNNEGNGIHSYTFTPSLSDWYSTDTGEEIQRLAFVFRNSTGSLVGREEDDSDIFYDLSDGSFGIVIQEPSATSILAELDEEITISAASSALADLEILVEGTLEESASNSQTISSSVSFSSPGQYVVSATATLDGETVSDEITIVITPEPTVADAPSGTQDGINYMTDGSVILRLYAPYKDNVFVLGDFNDWSHSLEFMMNRTPDATTWWVEISGLEPETEYRFQYSIDDDELRIADIYTEKILDPWNDPWISAQTLPDLTPYPTGLTSEAVSVLQLEQPEFPWTDQSYTKPVSERLNIYELLVRDFTEARNFQTIIDTLDYIQNMGINAIEFMPINEFEGNLSWGYNPSFFFAADKNYGGEENLKALINACHERGIAVIMDIALNHSFGQNPQVRMYFDADAGQFGQPTPQNPWFNETPTHDFNVGYDYNHENFKTKQFCERVLQYWINEYHIDGYRMDLSKGFTQTNSIGNIGFFSQYDQSRVDILTNYKNKVLEADPSAYFILEHFANNDEETVLANSGMMLWGNLNHEYNEAAMGYNSNFDWASYQNRGWNEPNVVAYMESHDEERLMYKSLLFGNNNGAYDITNLPTALDRIELVSTFFYTIPGPKMAWQFGELGYDFSINHCPDGTINEDCRTAEKPIRWDYLDTSDRTDIYDVVSLLNYLRNNYDFMHTSDFNLDVGGFGKRIHLNGDINATIIGNFGVTELSFIPGFQHTGTWYEVFTGDQIQEENLSNAFLLQPGEYRFYVDQELDLPSGINEIASASSDILIYPNPTKNHLHIDLPSEVHQAESIEIADLTGKTVYNSFDLSQGQREFEIDLDNFRIQSGIYMISIMSAGQLYTARFVYSPE